MKKLVTAMLALTLVLSLAAPAFASTEYTSSGFQSLGWDSATLTGTENMRSLGVAAVLIYYVLECPTADAVIQNLSYDGTAKIAKADSCVEIYLPLTDGNYLNLYANPDTGVITDYGSKALDGLDAATCHDVSMVSVGVIIAELNNRLSQ